MARGTPQAGPGPPTLSPPQPPRRPHSGRTGAAPGRGDGGGHGHADACGTGAPLTRKLLTANR